MSEFKAWMQAIGLHGKQVSKAGELIGMGRSTALLSYRDERRLTKTERLAMAAVVSQSSPWSLEHHQEIAAAGKVLAAVKEAYGSMSAR